MLTCISVRYSEFDILVLHSGALFIDDVYFTYYFVERMGYMVDCCLLVRSLSIVCCIRSTFGICIEDFAAMRTLFTYGSAYPKDGWCEFTGRIFIF